MKFIRTFYGYLERIIHCSQNNKYCCTAKYYKLPQILAVTAEDYYYSVKVLAILYANNLDKSKSRNTSMRRAIWRVASAKAGFRVTVSGALNTFTGLRPNWANSTQLS